MPYLSTLEMWSDHKALYKSTFTLSLMLSGCCLYCRRSLGNIRRKSWRRKRKTRRTRRRRARSRQNWWRLRQVPVMRMLRTATHPHLPLPYWTFRVLILESSISRQSATLLLTTKLTITKVCVHMTGHNCSTQYSTEQFQCLLSYPPDN